MSATGHPPVPTSDEAHWFRLLGRGVRKRCPNCGAGHVYRTWFEMEDRCPQCALKFEREPGFFVGAYLINFAIAIVLLFVLCMAFVVVKANDAEASPTAFLVVGLLMAVVGPILFYPFSRTLWSAIDIGMTPLEPAELAAMADLVDGGPPSEISSPS